jgi:hypothetical protein
MLVVAAMHVKMGYVAIVSNNATPRPTDVV